jgi:pimeloyl-ACP methyl ester carboxylesterase
VGDDGVGDDGGGAGNVAVRTHWYELGAGEPVALLHGGLERGEDWRDVAGELAADHRVLVPDRRGQGGTPYVPGP